MFIQYFIRKYKKLSELLGKCKDEVFFTHPLIRLGNLSTILVYGQMKNGMEANRLESNDGLPQF